MYSDDALFPTDFVPNHFTHIIHTHQENGFLRREYKLYIRNGVVFFFFNSHCFSFHPLFAAVVFLPHTIILCYYNIYTRVYDSNIYVYIYIYIYYTLRIHYSINTINTHTYDIHTHTCAREQMRKRETEEIQITMSIINSFGPTNII